MIRSVLNCRPGKVGELVKIFKTLNTVMDEMGFPPFRLYTDVAGEQFWTLVIENEYETLDESRDVQERAMADERVQTAMAGYHDLVVNGRREIYKVEA